MPIFDVTTPDGKVMEVNAPEGATAEDAIAFIASTYTPEPPPKQNTSNLGDIGTAFKQGVVGAGKSLTDIAGADNVASQYLGGIQERLGKQYRPQRIEEMQRRQQIIDEAVKSGSTFEEIKAYLGGVTEAPLQSIAQAGGSFAPYVAAGGLGAVARVAGLAVPAARTINTGLGAIQGTGAIKGSIYENVKRELEANGESPEIAAEKASQAQAYSMANAPQLGLGAVLGAAAGRYGAESLVTPGIANRLNANLIPRALTAAATEAVPEGFQGSQEQYATNLALGREGFDVDPMQGVIGSGARDALTGALVAAPIGAISRGQPAPPKPVLEPTKAQEKEELAKQSDPNIYNPAVRESAPQIAAMLLPEMKRFGLENVGLKVMDSIENGRADGMWANNLIHVALDKPNPMGSMRHESIHALRELGGFQENEWSALTNKAKGEWLQTFIKDTGKYEQYKKIYQKDNKTLAGFDSYIQEEAIAEAFRYFDKNGAPEGMIGAIYEKIKLMFEAMRNGFTGAGFQSADSIFRSLESGTREQVAPAGEVLNAARFSKPDTRRLDMNFKQVTERVPELTAAAEKVANGEMTAAQYDKLVNRYKPILPYDFVPQPTTTEEALDALKEDQKEKYGKTNEIPKGHRVGLRLDIPAYTKKGAWVNSIHNEGDDSMPFGVTYSNVSAVKNATFEMPEKRQEQFLNYARAAKDKKGETQAKFPGARIMGDWTPVNEKTAIKKMQAALNDPAWTQVGMDPERHSYFYDRKTTQPILSADEVIQIGPLVLAKNAKFGSKKDFKYSVSKVSNLQAADELARSANFKTNRDLKVELQKRALDTAKKNGLDLSSMDDKTVEYLNKIGLEDAEFSLQKQPNAVGWYDKTVEKALNIIGLMHPEINTDPDAKFAFTWALAVTSNGMKVDKNFELAEQAYRQFKQTGKMPTNIQAGEAQEAINQGLNTYNEMVEKYGIDDVRQFMATEFTVNQLRRITNLPLAEELADTKVLGAAILGPKIGNGFFSNLNGIFDKLTMDRWLMRTWGRWTGSLITERPDMVAKYLKETRAALSQLRTDKDLRENLSTVLKEPITPEAIDAILKDNASIAAFSERLAKIFGKKDLREYLSQTPSGNALRLSANTLNGYLDGQKEAPQGGGERNNIRLIFNNILKDLQKKEYPNLTMADLQAALWYSERRLYDAAKESKISENYTDDEAPDYANAAAKLAKQNGVPEELIQKIAKQTEEEYADRTRAVQRGGEEQPVETSTKGRVSGFAGKELKHFLAKGILQSYRELNAETPQTYRRGSGKDGKGFRVLGERAIAEYSPVIKFKNALKSIDVNVPKFYEFSADSAPVFEKAIAASKENNPYGASVYVYPVEDYANMRMFMTDDSRAGFALKDNDIVSVFSQPPHIGGVNGIMQLAIQEGGRKLDCFDTVLPDFYFNNGFQIASRLKWSEDQKPPDWNKETFSQFNDGEPDVVFMAYEPTNNRRPTNETGVLYQDYDQAVEAQAQAVQKSPKYSISAPDTKEFKQWFGDSKIVNADGSPKVYYHGTAQDITEFRPKQANAIFLTDNPKFAGSFSDLSKSYMERDAFQSASPTEQIYQLKTVKRLLEEEGRDTDSIAKDIKTLTSGRKLSSDFYLDGGYSDLLDYVNRDFSGAQNILPVFVKANNPFDYQKSDNVEKLLKTLNEAELKELMPYVSFDPNRLKKRIQEGSWNLIERKDFQSALKRAGFDGFYVSEGGNKNLAVYDSNQIKSFTNQAPTESKDIRFSIALNKLEPDTFLTSDKNPNALGNLGFMPVNSPFPKRPIRLQIGTRGDERGKAYGAKHILERALTDVAHRPVAVTKEALEDTILHIESLSKRFNRVYADGKQFILYDSQTDDAMVVTPMNGFYGVTTMYSNPNVQRRYGNPKWSGRNIQPPIEETGLKAKGISVRATEEGDIVQSAVPKAFKQAAKVISPDEIERQAENLPRKTGTLGIKKRLSLAAPDTTEFKQWFGNSKVVNEDGSPKVLYHGTRQDFDTFKDQDASYINKVLGKNVKGNFFFSDNPKVADQYALEKEGSRLIPVFLSLKNPMVMEPFKGKSIKEGLAEAKKNGHDGLIVANYNDNVKKSDMYIAFNAGQIKSAFNQQPISSGNKFSLAPNAPPQGTFTTLLPNETAGKRLTDTITNVMKFFKDPEERIKARIAFIDPNSGLARSLQDSPSYDANGVLRADLLARGKAQTINIIRNGLQTGIPIINSDGTVIIQRDDVNNLANSQAIADRLNDNQYVTDSGLSGRGYVAEVARALRGKEIMAEDAAFNKTQKNVKNHVNREKQIKPEQIAWAEQQLQNVPELEQIFDIWKNVNTGLLNLWEEVGLLDKKQADEYRSKKYYVSLAASNADLEEMMENQLGYTAAGLKSTPKIHKLKGSADLERNIWENIDKQYASMLAGAYQNQVRKIAVEQLIGAGAASIPSRMKNGKTVGAPLTEGINLRYKDPTNPLADNKGVVHVIVDNPVDLAAFETHHYELSPILKFFGGATNILRAGALINPMFWIRQLIRDPIHAALVANSGVTTPFHSAKEFINVLANNSPEARILAERGVIGQYDSTLDLQSYLDQTGKEQLPKGNLQKMFHKLMQIHEASDASTRVAIFKKEKQAALDRNMTEEQAVNFAVMKARESINFMVHGNSETLNALRQMIPFLSATITSLDTVYRAATGYNLPPAEKAAAQKLFKQRAAIMLGSSIAYAMLMQDDEEYQKLPNYIKDNNWLIKNPTGEGFIKVAVPYEVGFLFKTLPEVAIRGLAGNSTGKEMLKSYKDGFLHNLPTGGVPVPQAVKPALEVITNYSFFTGNPIESVGESRLPIEMRGRNASETAKFLSQAGLGVVGLSPAKIDALVQGYMAEAGTFTFTLADHLVTTVQGKEPTSKNLAKQPFFKAFLTDQNSNKAVSDFYQIEQTANQVAQEFSTMTKSGLGKEAVELMQDEDKRKLMASAPALRRVATSMTTIRKAIEATNNNQSIPPDERREMVNKLTAQYNRVAEQGVKLANTLGIR
jgi:hypothetical protein